MRSPYEDDAPEFSLREVLEVLTRRKWVILQAFVFVTIIGVITAALSPRVYATQAKLLVDTPGGVVLSQVNAMDALAPLMVMRQQKSVETQLAILRSGEFQKRIHSRLRPGETRAGVSLLYEPVASTSIIAVSSESTDPKMAAEWANTAAQEYVELTRESNRQSLTETRKYLQREVTRSKHDLDVAERKLLAFKTRTSMEESDEERSIRLKDAVDLEAKARETRSELLSLQVRIAGLKNRLVSEPETLKEPKIQANPELEAVRTQIGKLKAERAVALGLYQPGSTKVLDMDEQIKSLEETLRGLPPTIKEVQETPNPGRELLQKQLAELELQREAVAALNSQLQASSGAKTGRVAMFAPWQVELAQIQRERNLSEKTYLDYSDKLRELNVRDSAQAASASVMELAAVPSVPIRPQKAQQVAVAMVMGLLVGIGFAFLQEFLDDRVNTADDVERLTALPTLGVVPTIPAESSLLLSGQDALSPITERYRALRTSVHFSSIDHELRTLMVTSSHSGEGKSVTTTNLAIAMALEGKRVILVDADLRRPTVHHLLEMDGRVGLSNVLANDVPLEDALRETRIPGLRALPAGPLPPNPPELLSSHAMARTLAALQELADVVIFDTPPMIPVTDAHVLAPHMDGVVMVIEAGQTRKAALKHARDLLGHTRARILGVVLNKIDQSSKGHYYHYYYRSEYSERSPGERSRLSGASQNGSRSRQVGSLGTEQTEAPAREPVSVDGGRGGELPSRLKDWE